jgi:hypothetical protein
MKQSLSQINEGLQVGTVVQDRFQLVEVTKNSDGYIKYHKKSYMASISTSE